MATMEPPAAPVLVHLLNIEKLTNQGAPGFGPNTGTTHLPMRTERKSRTTAESRDCAHSEASSGSHAPLWQHADGFRCSAISRHCR